MMVLGPEIVTRRMRQYMLPPSPHGHFQGRFLSSGIRAVPESQAPFAPLGTLPPACLACCPRGLACEVWCASGVCWAVPRASVSVTRSRHFLTVCLWGLLPPRNSSEMQRELLQLLQGPLGRRWRAPITGSDIWNRKSDRWGAACNADGGKGD